MQSQAMQIGSVTFSQSPHLMTLLLLLDDRRWSIESAHLCLYFQTHNLIDSFNRILNTKVDNGRFEYLNSKLENTEILEIIKLVHNSSRTVTSSPIIWIHPLNKATKSLSLFWVIKYRNDRSARNSILFITTRARFIRMLTPGCAFPMDHPRPSRRPVEPHQWYTIWVRYESNDNNMKAVSKR